MKHETLIKEWIMADNKRCNALKHAAALELKDWCLAAGFVRNLVWDRIHGEHFSTPLNDIDLIYFNVSHKNKEADENYEAYLKSISNYPWSVKNQARMHIRNMDKPYSSTEDAMSYWVEVETAIGVRLSKNHDLKIVAPFGLDSLFNKTVTINSKRKKPEDFMARVNGKKWLELWPNLRLKS